jgi:transposase
MVAYGNAQLLSSSVGFATGPVILLLWEISKRCRVVKLIDKFRTSQRCSRYFHAFPRQRQQNLQDEHNVAIPLRQRPILWSRDVNAARNIRLIYQQTRDNGGERPESFQPNL